jgi:propanol-preferring alcohol dehydrogenase
VCAQAQFGGYTRNGGFAEYLLADPNYVAHIPAGLTAAEAAPLICAGITTYKGIKETEARPGEWVASLVPVDWATWPFSMQRPWDYSSV